MTYPKFDHLTSCSICTNISLSIESSTAFLLRTPRNIGRHEGRGEDRIWAITVNPMGEACTKDAQNERLKASVIFFIYTKAQTYRFITFMSWLKNATKIFSRYIVCESFTDLRPLRASLDYLSCGGRNVCQLGDSDYLLFRLSKLPVESSLS